MNDKLEIRVYVQGTVDGTITKEEVLNAYEYVCRQNKKYKWGMDEFNLIRQTSREILDNIDLPDGMAYIDEYEYLDEDEVLAYISECINDASIIMDADGQLMLFDPSQYEVDPWQLQNEKNKRFYELRKQTEEMKKSLDK